jgi:hypothetical protein
VALLDGGVVREGLRRLGGKKGRCSPVDCAGIRKERITGGRDNSHVPSRTSITVTSSRRCRRQRHHCVSMIVSVPGEGADTGTWLRAQRTIAPALCAPAC